MKTTQRPGSWVGVARETFERSMVPWVGRKHESWLRAWARPHPVDPGQILVPERIHSIYAAHRFMEPARRWELQAMGYPSLPPAEHGAAESADAKHDDVSHRRQSAAVGADRELGPLAVAA
jgi:hypothetical protein